MATPEEIAKELPEKFTTTNQGRSVKIRRRIQND
jgi:hypothetical protein